MQTLCLAKFPQLSKKFEKSANEGSKSGTPWSPNLLTLEACPVMSRRLSVLYRTYTYAYTYSVLYKLLLMPQLEPIPVPFLFCLTVYSKGVSCEVPKEWIIFLSSTSLCLPKQ